MAAQRKRKNASAAAAAAAAAAAVMAEDDPDNGPADDPPEVIEAEQELDAAAEAEGERRGRAPFVRLYRSHPALGGTDALLDELPTGQFTKSLVRQLYGGGRYRAEFFVMARGKMQIRKRENFVVDLSIPPKAPTVGEPAREHPAPREYTAPPAPAASILDQAVAAMLMNMIQQGQEMAKLQMSMMADHSAALQAQLKQLGDGRATGPDPLEILERAAVLLKPAAAAGSPLGLLRELLEVKDLLGAGAEREPAGALDVVRDLGPQLLATVNRALDARQPAPPRATVHEADGTPVAAVPQVGARDVLAFFGAWAPKLAKWAEQGRPAAWAAETITLEIPAGYHPALLAALTPDSIVEQIAGQFPVLAPFRDWLAEVRTEVLDLLGPDDELDDGASADHVSPQEPAPARGARRGAGARGTAASGE